MTYSATKSIVTSRHFSTGSEKHLNSGFNKKSSNPCRIYGELSLC